MAQVKGSGGGKRKKATPGQRAAAQRRAKARAVGAPANAVGVRVQRYPFGLKEVSWKVPVGRTVRNSRTINPVRLRNQGVYRVSEPTYRQGGYWGRS